MFDGWIAALLALFGVNASTILFVLVMERVNVGRETVDWKPFIYGCVAGAVPWMVIGLQLAVSQADSEGGRPPSTRSSSPCSCC